MESNNILLHLDPVDKSVFSFTEKQTKPNERLLRLGNVLECTENVQGPTENEQPTAGILWKKGRNIPFVMKNKRKIS